METARREREDRVLDQLAEWSDWTPLAEAIAVAPRLPGVYAARSGMTGPIVYVGLAGERSGSGRPAGLRGRLSVFLAGKDLTSGLGEAIFDRALADAAWLRDRIAEVERGEPLRAKEWGRAAVARADLHVRWTTTSDKAAAAALQRACLAALAGKNLWNQRR